MIDPLCKFCGSNPCVHGEQCLTVDEWELINLRDRVQALERENAALQARNERLRLSATRNYYAPKTGLKNDRD